MDKDMMRHVVKWIEDMAPSDYPETPLLRKGLPWGHDIPAYYWPTMRVKVEPFYTLHERLSAILDAIESKGDEFWEPSQEYLSLSTLRHDLWALAWDTVLNPEYDALSAAAYREEHPEKFRIEWVQHDWKPHAEPFPS
jgi:hypothetical protein